MDALVLLVTGLAAGVVSGLFGVGGGIVMTPALHYGVGLEWSHAVALSLFAIAVQAPIGVWRHARRDAVSWRIAWPLASGGLVGVAVGQWLQPHLGVPWLKFIFSILMGFAAWRIRMPEIPPRLDHAPLPVLLALGVAAGVVSRLLGIGGGLLTVPALVLLGTGAHRAVGTSLVPVFTNAVVATAGTLATGLDPREGVVMAAAAMAGTLGGTRIAHALPDLVLRRVFSVALVVTAFTIAVTSGVV